MVLPYGMDIEWSEKLVRKVCETGRLLIAFRSGAIARFWLNESRSVGKAQKRP